MNDVRRSLAAGVIAAQLLFVGGWLVLGATEGRGYSAARHDISDLGALTAQHATAYRLTVGIAGFVTIAFALLVLSPSLRSAGRAGVAGAWLVALSLPGLDTMSDAFFQLDCRAADAGCTPSDAFGSWHGKAHLISFVISALATVAAPFVLSRAMRRVAGWRELAGPTRAFGILTILLLAATGATTGTTVQGLTQRVAAVVITAAVAFLGWRVLRLTSRSPRTATLMAGR
ncbi:DUF998 domain-containing protein [Kribbella sp. GL6]|uniref:DUF998 domain-containing protein n=1 Tax=Kribbella sp. GL6 TaxID=3419765 RepID=UPI003D0843B6